MRHVHRAHDSIAAISIRRADSRHARQKGDGKSQDSKGCDKSSHDPQTHANALIEAGAIPIRFCGFFASHGLDTGKHHRYRNVMAQSFLVFDFGSNEELAQQARHKVDGWKQGFRLDKKLLLKFDRAEAPPTAEMEEKPAAKSSRKKPTEGSSKKGEAEGEEASAKENVQLIIRLDFSDHERLSHQRWLERIPSEVPFKEARSKIIRHTDEDFAGTVERFDSLP